MRTSLWLSAPLLVSAACADVAPEGPEAPELGSQTAELVCDQLTAWTPTSAYAAGQRVQHKGRAFECKVPGWCQQAAYEPLGSIVHPTAWLEAWTEIEDCGTYDPCAELSAYMPGQRYLAGARVERDQQIYECKPWPYSGHCGQAGYEPGTGQAWQDAWTLVSDCPSEPPKPDLTVVAYYLRPNDLPHRQEYYEAMVSAITTAQDWYREKLGFTFEVEYRSVVAQKSHLAMRCGDAPTPECESDVSLTPAWWQGTIETVGWDDNESKIVFAQGAGSFYATNLIRRYRGLSVVGDWVLEPVSGVREPAGQHCGMGSGSFFCPLAYGLVANQLGHLFGALRPVGIPNPRTIMDWWGDFPDTDLLPHERKLLALSPNLSASPYDAPGPFLYLDYEDIVPQGSVITLPGEDLENVTLVEFTDGVQTLVVEPIATSATGLTVQVPATIGLGFVRAHAGDAVSNALGIDFVPAQ